MDNEMWRPWALYIYSCYFTDSPCCTCSTLSHSLLIKYNAQMSENTTLVPNDVLASRQRQNVQNANISLTFLGRTCTWRTPGRRGAGAPVDPDTLLVINNQM